MIMSLYSMLFTLQRYEFFSKSQQIRAVCVASIWCCLPYKGTNFAANHNYYRWCCWRCSDVVYPTKVRIFQQITTDMKSCALYHGMLFTLQRYEFFSKSQLSFSASCQFCDVVYPTKVRIFQQITTDMKSCALYHGMLFTLQRYEFFSKSQLSFSASCQFCDVVYPTKVRIFQQITTEWWYWYRW